MLDKYKEHFSEERWNELCALIKDKGMKVSSKDFTVSEIKFLIDETPLSFEERHGAIMHYVDHIKGTEVAEQLNYSESTIKYHKRRVSRAIRETCCRIFK